MKIINENFKTPDLQVASTLYALGFKFAFAEWEDGKCFLYFEEKEKCEEISRKFFSGDLKVDAYKLFFGFKTIKTIIFNSQKYEQTKKILD